MNAAFARTSGDPADNAGPSERAIMKSRIGFIGFLCIFVWFVRFYVIRFFCEFRGSIFQIMFAGDDTKAWSLLAPSTKTVCFSII